jgi:(E)-4-hydroxy-3-methylbut-2-enyl-diphosphate synthase
MVQAYRLLVETMVKEGMNYPLHLGVTEAGDGEDGRIKSAVGIGALLEDGLGDTIRVSLTEDPEFEAPVAISLADRYKERELSVISYQLSDKRNELSVDSYQLSDNRKELSVDSYQLSDKKKQQTTDNRQQITDKIQQITDNRQQTTDNRQQTTDKEQQTTDNRQQITDNRQQTTDNHNPYEYQRRHSAELNTFIGGHQVPRVIIDLSHKNLKDPSILADVGYLYSSLLDKYNMAEQSTDFVYLADQLPSFNFPGNLKQLYNYSTWKLLVDKSNCHPFYSLEEFISSKDHDPALNLVSISNQDIDSELFKELSIDNTLVFVLETHAICGLQDQRNAFFKLMNMGLEIPVIIKRKYSLTDKNATILPKDTDFQLYAATDLGGLLLDGFGDGVWADASEIPAKTILSTSFGILQATRSRISKTEYISCPSCGRTLFDLQITTQMIRSRTDHLKGLKIGIMGCIVNGPGEMADADYGYVGTGPGKITLYRGKEVVKKNVNTENALDELIGIIRGDGNWVDPELDN